MISVRVARRQVITCPIIGHTNGSATEWTQMDTDFAGNVAHGQYTCIFSSKKLYIAN